MRRCMLLAVMCAALVLAMAPVASGQTVETAPLNPDGTCPEGFVTVNAPFCAQESPNTPGRIFGYGEGDLVDPTQYAPTTTAEAIDEETPSTTTTTPLPDTGGPSLALVAGALLLGAGLVLRHR